MIHRCRIRREEATGATDDYGEPVVAYTTKEADQPCYVWVNTAREAVDESRTALVTDARVLMPTDADFAAGDRLDQIQDRRGSTVLAGAWDVEGEVAPRKAHVEAPLTKVSG